MARDVSLVVENRLVAEKRDINVYHSKSATAHMISFDSSVKVSLGLGVEGDYLHVSVVSGPGRLQLETWVQLPGWLDFEYSGEGNIAVARSGGRIHIKIPPGLPGWSVKMTRPTDEGFVQRLPVIVVGDDRLAYRAEPLGEG